MTRMIGAAILAAGILLLVFGFDASNSLNSDISRFFTGSPTDKSLWMLIGGGVLVAAGLVGVMRGGK